MIFTRLSRKNGTASTFALTIALATGGAIGVTALEAPTYAQKKKDKEEKAKTEYSKAFVAAYTPLQEQINGEAPDYAALKAAVPGLVSSLETADDRLAAGNLIFNIGNNLDDQSLSLQGMELMLQSGKVSPESVGQYNFVAGQLAYNMEDYAKARTFFQGAAEAGYTENSPEIFIAETYFSEDNATEGMAYLNGIIDARVAAGEAVDEAWLKRGLAMAYNNQMKAEANKYAAMYVSQYPSDTSWGDAVAILLNTGGYQNPEILDLLRLGRRVDALRDGRLYLEYAEAADYRRLPAEVVEVIDEGFSSGKVDQTDPYAVDTRKQAAERAAADRADADSLLRRAQADGAPLRTVMTTGDAMLSMGRAADAEQLYTKALGLPSADMATITTRLGIAQVEQGKFDEAQATFEKVNGTREPIADLWAIYASQQAGGAAQPMQSTEEQPQGTM